MKKIFSLVIILVLTLSIFSVAAADSPAPGGPFSSAFRVQNLETTDATCSYEFYDANGNVAFTSPAATIAPGDSLYVYTPSLSGLADGTYSAVVSCDKKVAAVSNFSDPNSGSSHSGISSPGTEWYAPGIYDNYYNYYSNIIAQNATASPIDITVDIYEPGNTTPVYSETKTNVPGYASVSFEQEGLSQLANNQFYSAKISGTGDIAPIVNIYGRGPYLDQLYSYNPFKGGSTTAYAPVIMNNYYGYNTALVVQNIGSTAAAVKVTYTNGYETDHTVAPGAAVSLYTPDQSGLPAGNTLYGATVTSDQPVVLIVNESNKYNRADSYSGFAEGSTEVRVPIVEKRYYKYNSSVTCQNIGSAPTTMTIEYAGITNTTTSTSVDPGGTYLFLQQNDPVLSSVPLNWISSATITASQNIVCVVNQDMNESPENTQVMDQLYSYNAIDPNAP